MRFLWKIENLENELTFALKLVNRLEISWSENFHTAYFVGWKKLFKASTFTCTNFCRHLAIGWLISTSELNFLNGEVTAQ